MNWHGCPHCTDGFLAVFNPDTGEVLGDTACHHCRPFDARLVEACREINEGGGSS